ncbi:hypothetical protein [Paraburkholderia solisilvae]|uniref:Translation initiation factor IF-2 n=1 Tax=Paraburkholderia solisilvae TaxID=624376 RepID=A0A6J5EWK5_9BURK|nr:hypothetical protein [Paraburkholderia solisilvae]CAB3770978.1 hypothetical protein LMG29739_05917 [Paraburkholderia solisilvae]
MESHASLSLISAALAAVALCGGCAVYPGANAPPAYGYAPGDYGGYDGYDNYGYGYPPAQSNVYLGFGGYSGPSNRDPYWRRGYRGDWNDGRHPNSGGNQNPHTQPPSHTGGGGPPAGGGGHPPAQGGYPGGGKAPPARSVDVSPNNGSRATNH